MRAAVTGRPAAVTLALLIGAAFALGVAPRAEVQEPPLPALAPAPATTYEIEVLPGVIDSDPMNEKRWSIDAAGNATVTAAGSSSRRRRNIRRPVALATAKAPSPRVDAIGVRVDDDRAD